MTVWVAWVALLGIVLATPAPYIHAQSPRQLRPLPATVGVHDLLRHAATAAETVDYEGTKILSTLRGRLMETVTVNEAHKRPSLTRLEFLSPEGMAGRLVLVEAGITWHYEPRLNAVFVGPSIAAPPGGAADVLVGRYRARLLGEEEVIGRPAAVVSLRFPAGPRERRLWIDRATGVALRSEERDPEEGVVASAYFTRVSFGLNLPAALFQRRVPAGARVSSQWGAGGPPVPIDDLRKSLRVAVMPPPSLPGGFTLIGGTPIRDGAMLAAHLQYSDGVRALALFVAPSLGGAERGDPVEALGPEARTVVMGPMRLLQWKAEGSRLTLVGPLSLADMLRVAAAIAKPAR